MTTCPYCNTDVSESSIEANDGCCPECGAMLSAGSMYMDDYDDDYDDDYLDDDEYMDEDDYLDDELLDDELLDEFYDDEFDDEDELA